MMVVADGCRRVGAGDRLVDGQGRGLDGRRGVESSVAGRRRSVRVVAGRVLVRLPPASRSAWVTVWSRACRSIVVARGEGRDGQTGSAVGVRSSVTVNGPVRVTLPVLVTR